MISSQEESLDTFAEYGHPNSPPHDSGSKSAEEESVYSLLNLIWLFLNQMIHSFVPSLAQRVSYDFVEIYCSN